MPSHRHLHYDTESSMTLLQETQFFKSCWLIPWRLTFTSRYIFPDSLGFIDLGCVPILFLPFYYYYFLYFTSCFHFLRFFVCLFWVVSRLLTQWDTALFVGQRRCSTASMGKKLSCCVERVGENVRRCGTLTAQSLGLLWKGVTSLTLFSHHLLAPTGLCPLSSSEAALVKDIVSSLTPKPSSGLILLGSLEASDTTGHSLLLDTHAILHTHKTMLPGISFSCTDCPSSSSRG